MFSVSFAAFRTCLIWNSKKKKCYRDFAISSLVVSFFVNLNIYQLHNLLKGVCGGRGRPKCIPLLCRFSSYTLMQHYIDVLYLHSVDIATYKFSCVQLFLQLFLRFKSFLFNNSLFRFIALWFSVRGRNQLVVCGRIKLHLKGTNVEGREYSCWGHAIEQIISL